MDGRSPSRGPEAFRTPLKKLASGALFSLGHGLQQSVALASLQLLADAVAFDFLELRIVRLDAEERADPRRGDVDGEQLQRSRSRSAAQQLSLAKTHATSVLLLSSPLR